jgi:hypothetical protein
MAIFTLNSQQTAWLAERQAVLTVTLATTERSTELELVQVNTEGSTRAVYRLASHRWLVRALQDPFAVRLQSRAGLPQGTDCDVSLSADRDEVRLHTLDLSGVRQVTLFDVATEGSRMRVTALPDQIKEVALPPTAHAARRLAREINGNSDALPARQLVVVVDASSSMKPFFSSGLVATIVETLVGSVAARAESICLTLVLAAHEVLSVDEFEAPLKLLNLPDPDETKIRSLFCASLANEWPEASDRTTYVITDDVPHDLELLRSGSASHLVLIQPSNAAQPPGPVRPCTVWFDDQPTASPDLIRSLLQTPTSKTTERVSR